MPRRRKTGMTEGTGSKPVPSRLPAKYTPRVAGYARGPFLDAITVTPTPWRWINCRTYLVLNRTDGQNYRAVRVVDERTRKFVGYWAVEALGTPLPLADWSPDATD